MVRHLARCLTSDTDTFLPWEMRDKRSPDDFPNSHVFPLTSARDCSNANLSRPFLVSALRSPPLLP
jgi:hypothetical protein